jgi:hypothetical protein
MDRIAKRCAKLALFGALAAIVLSTAACGIATADYGSVRITLPAGIFGDAYAKAVFPQGAMVDTIRVRLLQNGKVLKISEGREFVSQGISAGQDVNIFLPGLLPGPGYQAEVVVGDDQGVDGFATYYYGNSDIFDITAGVLKETTILLKPNRFSTLVAAGRSSAAVVADVLWYLDGTNLVSNADPDNPIDLASVPDLAGVRVNTLSTGKKIVDTTVGEGIIEFPDQLWLNTDDGIYAYDGGTFTRLMPADMSPDVYTSSALQFKIPVEEFVEGSETPVEPINDVLMVLFQGKGLVMGGGGTIDPNQNPEEWGWFNFADSIGDSPELAEMLSGMEGELIQTPVFGEEFFYINTQLGAFRIGMDLQETIATAIQGVQNNETEIDFAWVNENIIKAGDIELEGKDAAGNRFAIKQISAAMTAADRGRLVVAGNAGLYTALIDTYGKVQGALGKVVGTDRSSFSILTSIAYDGAVHTAGVDTDGNLFILKDGVVTAKYSAFMGLPKEPSGLTWDTSSGLAILMAGQGLMRLPLVEAAVLD